MKTYKAKNGKSYTKKQICEAIEYWKKQLKRLDEGRYRKGDIIYTDQVPTTGDESDTYSKLGVDASIITVDEWKRDKLWPTEQIEKCANMQDLKNIAKKYGKKYLIVNFPEPEMEVGDVTIIPIDADDGVWFKKEFGTGSVW